MGYTKHRKKIPVRKETMLIRGPNGRGGTYDERAPGLYPDETAVDLDDGSLVAVSVERHWNSNGAGLAFHAYARLIEPDGTTVAAPNDADLESVITFNADPVTLDKYGEQAIADDLARLVLGEETQLKREVPVEDGAEPLEVAIVSPSEEAKLNASIRFQARAAKASTKTALRL